MSPHPYLRRGLIAVSMVAASLLPSAASAAPKAHGVPVGACAKTKKHPSRQCLKRRRAAKRQRGVGSTKAHHSSSSTQATSATPFAPDSVWNEPLRANPPLAPRSAAYVNDLLSQIASDGTWINTYAYSTPVFTVPATQRTTRVTLDAGFSPAMQALQQTWADVPIPPKARPASGTDAQMVIWQPATDTMWEFWQMHHDSAGWHAAWGGTIYNLSSNPGYYTAPQPTWGATAPSLPLLGGLIRPSELASGHIDHALSLGIPQAQAEYFAWPAQRTDGSAYSRTAIPEGQRFRLDPHLNLNKIPMAPIVKMIAVAAQKYGIIVRDQAGAVTFYAEDTDAEGLPNPYYGASGYFQDQYVNNLLKSFPWAHLQALKDDLTCCWHN